MKAEQIKQYAKKLGADLVGIAPAEFDAQGEEHLKDFIEQGRHGNMAYLEDYQKRVHPQQLLPGAQSVIVIAVNYYQPAPPLPSGHGRIARYAYGRDYHRVLKKLLTQLATFIHESYQDDAQDPSIHTKICIDSAPLLEKSYAVKAGLGFIGKNTMLITPEYGSFVVLGEILTTLKLDYDQPVSGTCGTCTRCLDACPTDAFIGPRQLEAKSCISYLTIENKGPIPKRFHKAMEKLIFGCDICQDVCPYNKVYAKPLQLEAFKPVAVQGVGASLPLKEILAIKTDEEYVARFAGSPLMRAKRRGLQRNAKIALKNARNQQLKKWD